MASNSISFSGTNYGVQVGVNHGSIYPPIERPETPPAPFSNCPFRRDPDFVDRGTLLEEVYQKGCVPAARIALVGLGGVGKSQLAIECCYRIEERSPQTWVFWIHAANAERFEKSCWDIVNRLKIPGRKDPKANVFQLIYNWFLDKRNGKWVVILDNVDDSRFLHETPANANGQEDREGPLLEYFPVTDSGSIIITSRTRDAVDSLVEPGDIITIGPMNESDAAELFSKKLGEPGTQDANQLIRELDFMPLAIVQAAVHIRHRAPRLSVSQYLQKFQQNDRERIRLLKHEKGQLRRDREAKNSILVTWQISFDHIQRVHPAAADVLSLMCLFDRQGIPENLIRYYKREMDDNHSLASSESRGFSSILHDSAKADTSNPALKAASAVEPESETSSVHSTDSLFEDCISTLRDYSLVHIDVDDTAFEMHRLVQLAMRQWLEAHGQLEQWKKRFTGILLLNFPTERWDRWSVCQLLLPHVLSAVKQPPTKELTLGKWAQLIQTTAEFTLDKGNYARSEELAMLAFNTRANLFGSQDERTLDSLSVVGQATHQQGKWKHAEQVHRQVIDAHTQISGPESSATLTGMNNLASIYWAQGRWDEAEQIHLQVLEVRKRINGPEDLDTLASMSNLASTYEEQGRLNQAEHLQLQVLEAHKHIRGPKHPHTLTSMGNLALIYNRQGRWSEANELEMQVIEVYKRVLGPEHPETLLSMSNLATTYSHQGQWDQAEELQVQVLDMRKRIMGPEHPDTLMSMNNLASIYRYQGLWDESHDLRVQVLEVRKRILGPEHPDTLASMSNLASTYNDQGRWDEGQELDLQVLDVRKRILGPEHPDTLMSMGNLASVYSEQGQWSKAQELEEQVLRIRKEVLGPEHPDTLLGMNNYAHTLWLSDHNSSAIRLMTDCAQISIRTMGPEHPDTIHATSVLDKWRETKMPLCAEDVESPPEKLGEAIEDKGTKSQPTVSKADPQPSRRKRSIISRLFRKN